jgi:hypothetical protein
VHLVVDSIVHAAREAADASNGDMRAILRAAFGRARALGLGVDEVDDTLASRELKRRGAK